jgi:hypothetical protein
VKEIEVIPERDGKTISLRADGTECISLKSNYEYFKKNYPTKLPLMWLCPGIHRSLLEFGSWSALLQLGKPDLVMSSQHYPVADASVPPYGKKHIYH